MRALSG